jgi:hypothetical protein
MVSRLLSKIEFLTLSSLNHERSERNSPAENSLFRMKFLKQRLIQLTTSSSLFESALPTVCCVLWRAIRFPLFPSQVLVH